MDWHIERFLNRLSLLLSLIATLSLLHLFTHTSLTCTAPYVHPPIHTRTQNLTLTIPNPVLLPGPHHPNSSCDLLSRAHIPPQKRLQKILLSAPFKSRVRSLSSLFRSLPSLSNSSRVLAVSAGVGHAVVSLHSLGVADVTAVDVIDFPPLVSRADPHNLPFFDGVFDLAFSDGVDNALFPRRFVEEMERTVRKGGAEVVVVGPNAEEEVKGMFAASDLVEARNVTVMGAEMVMIIMKNNGKSTNSSTS